jgi:hypothetical protein
MKSIPLDAFENPPKLQDLMHRIHKRKQEPELLPKKKKERISFVSKDSCLYHQDWIHIQKIAKKATQKDSCFIDSSLLDQYHATKVFFGNVEKDSFIDQRTITNRKRKNQSLRTNRNFAFYESSCCEIGELGFLI